VEEEEFKKDERMNSLSVWRRDEEREISAIRPNFFCAKRDAVETAIPGPEPITSSVGILDPDEAMISPCSFVSYS
jgi:hypothetical protein